MSSRRTPRISTKNSTVPGIVCTAPGNVRTSVATPLIASRKWLCVLGAVGQPRDENPAAAWCLLDTDKGEVTYNRAGYDIERAAKKIHDAGLPQILAARLFIGR